MFLLEKKLKTKQKGEEKNIIKKEKF